MVSRVNCISYYQLDSYWLLFSMLLISRSMDLWKISSISSLCSIDKLSFPSFSISSFSSRHFLLFVKSSRSCIFLLPTHFTYVICPSMASRKRQFLLRIWPIQLDFLRRILFRSHINKLKLSTHKCTNFHTDQTCITEKTKYLRWGSTMVFSLEKLD